MNETTRVEFLTPGPMFDGYVEAMTLAFENYPVPVRAFRDSPGPRIEWVRRLLADFGRTRLDAGLPILAALIGDQVAGGALLAIPQQTESRRSSQWDEFMAAAGEDATTFFDSFRAAVDSVTIPEPNVWVNMLGVHPSFQRQGVGRLLLERTAEYAKTIPGVLGVGLDTEDDVNVKIYEACGFSVQGTTSVENLPIWVLFRAI